MKEIIEKFLVVDKKTNTSKSGFILKNPKWSNVTGMLDLLEMS